MPKCAHVAVGNRAPEAHLVEDDSGIAHGAGYPNSSFPPILGSRSPDTRIWILSISVTGHRDWQLVDFQNCGSCELSLR